MLFGPDPKSQKINGYQYTMSHCVGAVWRGLSLRHSGKHHQLPQTKYEASMYRSVEEVDCTLDDLGFPVRGSAMDPHRNFSSRWNFKPQPQGGSALVNLLFSCGRVIRFRTMTLPPCSLWSSKQNPERNTPLRNSNTAFRSHTLIYGPIQHRNGSHFLDFNFSPGPYDAYNRVLILSSSWMAASSNYDALRSPPINLSFLS
ncbi:hypothetical protein FPV67DRAFT_1466408 [Lyophyllum atratum]|nr:hypothetical protein FPV67DRAFT_1466408 [Lyophyllum atratum]